MACAEVKDRKTEGRGKDGKDLLNPKLLALSSITHAREWERSVVLKSLKGVELVG